MCSHFVKQYGDDVEMSSLNTVDGAGQTKLDTMTTAGDYLRTKRKRVYGRTGRAYGRKWKLRNADRKTNCADDGYACRVRLTVKTMPRSRTTHRKKSYRDDDVGRSKPKVWRRNDGRVVTATKRFLWCVVNARELQSNQNDVKKNVHGLPLGFCPGQCQCVINRPHHVDTSVSGRN